METPLIKNEIYDVTVSGVTHDGMGVARINGFPVFIKYALPGEEVSVKIILVKKSFAIGKLLDIHKQNEFRAEPRCPIYKACGGCTLQHIAYEGQLNLKTETVKETLKRIGKIETVVHDCIGMENAWKYRNKTQVPFGTMNGKTVAGFYKENTHEIIDMASCDIQDALSDEIIIFIKQLCEKYKIMPYREESHSGFLRHVISRYGYITKEYMVTFVTREKTFPNKDKFLSDLIKNFPQIKSVVQNINSLKTNTIMGEESILLYGEKYIFDYIGDVKFAISSQSFYQVNPIQTKKLYETVKKYAKLTGNEIIIDAYCGIGTIGLYLAKQAKAIYGVEIVPEAIEDAKLNAKLNGFENAHYETGKAEDVIKKWQKENIHADVIIVDPPRKGCDENFLETVIEMQIPKMVYVSCDPATLARDLKILSENNYNVIEVQPVDMFPHTMHVENVVLLELKK